MYMNTGESIKEFKRRVVYYIQWSMYSIDNIDQISQVQNVFFIVLVYDNAIM